MSLNNLEKSLEAFQNRCKTYYGDHENVVDIRDVPNIWQDITFDYKIFAYYLSLVMYDGVRNLSDRKLIVLHILIESYLNDHKIIKDLPSLFMKYMKAECGYIKLISVLKTNTLQYKYIEGEIEFPSSTSSLKYNTNKNDEEEEEAINKFIIYQNDIDSLEDGLEWSKPMDMNEKEEEGEKEEEESNSDNDDTEISEEEEENDNNNNNESISNIKIEKGEEGEVIQEESVSSIYIIHILTTCLAFCIQYNEYHPTVTDVVEFMELCLDDKQNVNKAQAIVLYTLLLDSLRRTSIKYTSIPESIEYLKHDYFLSSTRDYKSLLDDRHSIITR
ncbi:hypothetical protein WA158_001516 [Blastocystis sp. Blastoise]